MSQNTVLLLTVSPVLVLSSANTIFLNVGNFTPPDDGSSSWLPDDDSSSLLLPNDFPRCDHPFLKSMHHIEPNCTCYKNEDAVLDQGLTDNHRCSRDYLCSHVSSEVSQLKRYKPSGV